MSSRSRLVKPYPVTGNGDANTLEVSISYNAGGINYFNCKEEKRGFYVNVMPYKISHEGHFQSKCYSAFSGTKMLVEEVSRFSQKKLDALTLDEDMLKQLVDNVLSANGLTIKEDAIAA